MDLKQWKHLEKARLRARKQNDFFLVDVVKAKQEVLEYGF
jgi:hypothetical protein